MTNSELYNYSNSNNNDDNISSEPNVLDKKIVKDERYIFGNFFGLVSDKYIKYFNLICFEFFFTVFFALLYYGLMLNFNENFHITNDFKPSHFLDHKLLMSFIMSLEFQTTIAYVDLKCKSVLSRVLQNLQVIETVLLAFLFLTV
jgi:hypothetical protein